MSKQTIICKHKNEVNIVVCMFTCIQVLHRTYLREILRYVGKVGGFKPLALNRGGQRPLEEVDGPSSSLCHLSTDI